GLGLGLGPGPELLINRVRVRLRVQKIIRAGPGSGPEILGPDGLYNPPTQRAIAKSLHIAQSSVSNIIKNAAFVLRKKRKVQSLTSSNIMKRQQRSHRLCHQLANQRCKQFITTDESWFYLDGVQGKRQVSILKNLIRIMIG
ncbi:unnamed protein product, partial [Rotaria magnacalcarata]